jgi:hypothetical protein
MQDIYASMGAGAMMPVEYQDNFYSGLGNYDGGFRTNMAENARRLASFG